MLAEVQNVIDTLRPAVQADGADLALRGVDETTGVVTVELLVPGYGCSRSDVAGSLARGVERIVRDRVPGVTAVEPVATCAGGDDPAGCGHEGGACGHHEAPAS